MDPSVTDLTFEKILGCTMPGPEATLKATLVHAELLGNMAAGSYGPYSCHKIIQAHDKSGPTTISSISGRIFEGIRIEHPVAKFLVATTALSQYRSHGDGGLFSLIFASRLITAALQDSPCASKRHIRSQAYHIALDWCLKYLTKGVDVSSLMTIQPEHCGCLECPHNFTPQGCTPAVCTCPENQVRYRSWRREAGAHVPVQVGLPVQLHHLQSVLALVRGVILPKHVTGLDLKSADFLAVMVAQAFIGSLPDLKKSQRVHKGACVRVVQQPGADTLASQYLEGCLLDTPMFTTVEQALPHKGGALLLFNVSLDVDLSLDPHSSKGKCTGTFDGKVVITQSAEGEPWSAKQVQLDHLMSLAEAMHRLGVHVVASQKVIHPYLQEALLARGILPLHRLSLRHITSVARLSGARPLSSTRPAASWKDVIGHVGDVREYFVGRRKFVMLQPPPKLQATVLTAPVTTLVLRAPSDIQLQELAAVVDSSISMLSSMLNTPVALPGGGCTETLLANHVRWKAKCTIAEAYLHWDVIDRRILMRSWESFASTLEEMASLLLPHQLREGERVGRQCGEGPGCVHRANSGFFSVDCDGRAVENCSQGSTHEFSETAALSSTTCSKQICKESERHFFGWDSRANGVCVVARCTIEQVCTETTAGVEVPDVDTHRLQILEAGLIEPFLIKTTALASAVEAASAIIRTHDVVVEH